MSLGPIRVTSAPTPSDFHIRMTKDDAVFAAFQKELSEVMAKEEAARSQEFRRHPIPKVGSNYVALIHRRRNRDAREENGKFASRNEFAYGKALSDCYPLLANNSKGPSGGRPTIPSV